MSIDASKKLLTKTIGVDESNLSSFVAKPSLLDSLNIGNITSLTGKLMNVYNDIGSLSDITPAKLQSIANMFEVDLGDFKKILDMSVKIEESGLLNADKESIKTFILDEVFNNNLLGTITNGNIKKLLSDYLDIDINDLTNMFKSS
jgi:hypothetical protein